MNYELLLKRERLIFKLSNAVFVSFFAGVGGGGEGGRGRAIDLDKTYHVYFFYVTL